MNNYDYPIGTDTPSAPWNDNSVSQTPIKVNVMVSYSISKSTTIETDDYVEEPIEVEDACVAVGFNLDNTNWEEAFESDSDALGIPDLLSILEDHATVQYLIYKDALELNPNDKQTQKLVRKYERIRKACQEWHVDEFIVERE